MQKKTANRLLLVNPPSTVYAHSKIKVGITYIPQISLASLAAMAERDGHTARILDLCVCDNPIKEFKETLKIYQPTTLGITVMTPNFNNASGLARLAKEVVPDILTIAGGAHPSVLPEETVSKGKFDVAVISEGEETMAQLLEQDKCLSSIHGIAFRADDGAVKRNPDRAYINDLDSLPMPAWHLFDLSRYKASRLTSRKPPVGAIETSRGCPHACIYCSKDIFSRKVRYKSVNRVLLEIEHAKHSGFRELHVWDDHFATNIKRGKEICQSIIEKGIQMSLNMFSGMRVDNVDYELFHLLKQAGCYCVALAPETGNQKLLDAINKGITLDDCRRAFGFAKRAGLETTAFFMIALPGETPKTIEETIKFAIELSPDYAKVSFATPLPGTELFRMLQADNRIKTYDWSKYAFHDVSEVYEHPTMSWADLEHYYDTFYNRFYLRPGYILKRLIGGISNGRVIYDIYYALKTWFRNRK
ncbi:MAG: B12-binding domain-containing radical SAM protein [Candidatus Scalindua sp.]|nr:B12-binding domain-containing radical SAM protein [Candidatus Scalindua sp.]